MDDEESGATQGTERFRGEGKAVMPCPLECWVMFCGVDASVSLSEREYLKVELRISSQILNEDKQVIEKSSREHAHLWSAFARPIALSNEALASI